MNTHSAIPPSTVNSSTKPPSVSHTWPALTRGLLASSVLSSPCTIHGWRPISVITQPAVLIRNGVTPAKIPNLRNRRDVTSRPLRHSHRPTSANRSRALHV